MLNPIELEDEDLALFEAEKKWTSFNLPADSAEEKEMYGQNLGVNAKMDSQTEELFSAVIALGNEYRRRFDNLAGGPAEDLSLKEKITQSAILRGYGQGMQHALMLMRQLNIPVDAPGDELLPELIKERKDSQKIEGIIPTVDELEKPKAEKVDYEGDYVIAKGKKYFEQDILDLINDASIVNDSLTKQGQAKDDKIGKARALFPGKTDDEIIGMDFKQLDKSQRAARSYIRDNFNNRVSAARKYQDMKAAKLNEEANEGA